MPSLFSLFPPQGDHPGLCDWGRCIPVVHCECPPVVQISTPQTHSAPIGSPCQVRTLPDQAHRIPSTRAFPSLVEELVSRDYYQDKGRGGGGGRGEAVLSM